MIKNIIELYKSIGIEMDDNMVYFILGVIVPILIEFIRKNVIMRIYHSIKKQSIIKTNHIINNYLDQRFSNVSYFPIIPIINIKDSQHSLVKIDIRSDVFTPRFSPDIENIDAFIDNFIKTEFNIKEGSIEFQKKIITLKQRILEAEFASEDKFYSDNTSDYSIFNQILSDRNRLKKIKEKVLRDYLLGNSKGNGFLHNGKLFAVYDYEKIKNNGEEFELHITLEESDYFTYRVIAELSQIIRELLKDYLGSNPNYLSEYIAHFQRNIHYGLGLGIMIHTYVDDRIIITRRSANAAQNTNEAGKYFMSVCEGINNNDINADDRSELRPLIEIIHRAIREEIYGKGNAKNLYALIKKCVLTGSFLYLPNMSIELCFYVGIDCTSDEIRHQYLLAKDSGLETSEIINEKKWDKRTGLPQFNAKSINKFIMETIKNKKPIESWDEGSLTVLRLSMLYFESNL